jgi:hypothetical protein
MVDARIAAMDLTHFAPFTVVSFDTRRNANETIQWRWDGHHLERKHAFAPIISAAVNYEQARAYRYNLFNELIASVPDNELGRLFHHTYDADYPALSPLMERKDARTVSFTSVVVSNSTQMMRYQSIDTHRQVDLQATQYCLKTDTVAQGVFK